MSNECDDDGIKRASADQPSRIGFASYQRSNKLWNVLFVDSQNCWKFNMTPLSHGDRFTGTSRKLEDSGQNVGGTSNGCAVASKHAPTKLTKRWRDSCTRKTDHCTEFSHSAFSGLHKALSMSSTTAFRKHSHLIESRSINNSSAKMNASGRNFYMSQNASTESCDQPIVGIVFRMID